MAQKSAGLRTYSFVGVGSRVFMLIGIFGFADGVRFLQTSLAPSQVAADRLRDRLHRRRHHLRTPRRRDAATPRRRDAVRGLATAAGVWVSAAVGMACGGGGP
jgi:putative Mg2+ transporter-C (MgtC) family protein